MVTDVYSHITNGDRKRLAKKMDAQFFSPNKTTLNESSQQIVQLLEKSPDLADLLLQMTRVLGEKQEHERHLFAVPIFIQINLPGK